MHPLVRMISWLVVANLVLPGFVPDAGAAPGASQLCAADVEIAASKFAQCRLKAEFVFTKTGDAARRADALAKCSTKLAGAFTRASAKYGAACPMTESPAAFETALTSCTDDVAAAASGSPFPASQCGSGDPPGVPIGGVDVERVTVTGSTVEVEVRAPLTELPNLVTTPPKLNEGSIAHARLFGPGLVYSDAWANLRSYTSGGFAYGVALRMRVTRTGTLSSMRTAFEATAGATGYAAGNGGIQRIRVLKDNGSSQPDHGQPVIAQATFIPGLVAGGYPGDDSSLAYQEIPFSAQGTVTAGEIIHVVVDNVSATGDVDFLSINNMTSVASRQGPARFLQSTDWGVAYGYRPASDTNAPLTWFIDYTSTPHPSLDAFYAPVLQLKLTDGSVMGHAMVNVGNVDTVSARYVYEKTSASGVRERWPSLSQQETISGFSVMCAAKAAGGLAWVITSNGAPLASGTITQASANYAVNQQSGFGGMGLLTWYDVPLPSPLVLPAGSDLAVELVPVGSSRWIFADQGSGSAVGFEPPAALTDSRAEHLVGGAWVNADHFAQTSTTSLPLNHWRIVMHRNTLATPPPTTLRLVGLAGASDTADLPVTWQPDGTGRVTFAGLAVGDRNLRVVAGATEGLWDDGDPDGVPEVVTTSSGG